MKYFAVTTTLPERPAVVSLNELTDFQEKMYTFIHINIFQLVLLLFLFTLEINQ